MSSYILGAEAANGSTASQGRWQARSVVVSRTGIVATESPLAAQAGAMVLAQGGHAVDAAVAANAVMGVVAPHSNGVGGDLFAVIFDAASKKIYGLNASGWSPAAMNINSLIKRGFSLMPPDGIHSVSVPGAVDGWEKILRRFGRRTLSQLLQPAIHFAQEGFPVTEWVAQRWDSGKKALNDDPNAARTFLPAGRAPRFGEIVKNTDLANTLRQIAAGGRQAFYEGEIAHRILQSSEQFGGAMTAADLAEFESEWVKPISINYRGWTVSELPPNGQGVAALAMLNLMENFPLAEMGHNSADSLHVMIESKKLAYADMLRCVADPRFSSIPMAEILSKAYAKERAGLIEMNRAGTHANPGQFLGPGGDTIYLSVVDRDGNLVSLIQSNFAIFGSGIVPRETGFVLQNRASLFSLDPAHPNALAGRKRPLHTIIPGFMSRGEVRIAFGIQGGWNQSQAHAQFVSNIVDHGMNIQAALEAARFTKHTFDGADLQMESRIPQEVIRELSNRGHQIEKLGVYSDVVGGGQAAMRNEASGVNYGASDPRKDGQAIPEPSTHFPE